MNMKAVPKAAPTPLPELETSLQPFAKLFRRSWSRQSCERYITGLLDSFTTQELRHDSGSTCWHLNRTPATFADRCRLGCSGAASTSSPALAVLQPKGWAPGS